jgi:hypothetical protein
VIAAAPGGTDAYAFRTAAGVEIDLLLKLPGHRNPGRSRSGAASPKLERGFHLACDTDRRRVVYGVIERFPPLGDGADVGSGVTHALAAVFFAVMLLFGVAEGI